MGLSYKIRIMSRKPRVPRNPDLNRRLQVPYDLGDSVQEMRQIFGTLPRKDKETVGLYVLMLVKAIRDLAVYNGWSIYETLDHLLTKVQSRD